MKISRFKEYNESTSSIDYTDHIRFIDAQIKQIDDMSEMIEDEDDWKEMKKQIDELPMPKVAKQAFGWSIVLMSDSTFREKIKLQLNYLKKCMLEGKSQEEISKDSGLIEDREKLEILGSKILNISIDEMKRVTNQFLGGVQKYKDNKEKTRQITSEDPYGEEDWSSETEEEQIKKAFGGEEI